MAIGFVGRAMHRCETDRHRQSADGYALASVLLIMVILSVSAIPLLDAVMRNRETVTEQRIITHLTQEARENLELGVYAVNFADGFPASYALGAAPQTRPLALACTKRLNTVNPDLLDGISLDDRTVRQTQSVAVNFRIAVTFIVGKSANAKNRLDRFIIVSCAMAPAGQLAVFATEIARVTDGYQTLSSGQY
jgi:hypothetical protein